MAAAEPSTVSSSSGELRSKKRARAFDYFLVRLAPHLARSVLSSRGFTSTPHAEYSPYDVVTAQVLDCEATCNQSKDLVRASCAPWPLRGR